MAIVLTSLVAAFTRTPFVKPPDLVRGATAMPRSLVNFALLDATLDAKPTNDQQELNISIVLPREFAYRLADVNITTIQDVASSWAPFGYLEITNGVRGLQGGATQRHSIVLDQEVIRIPTAVNMWIGVGVPQRLPTYVIQAIDGSAPVIVFKATNRLNPAGAAGTVNCLFTFFEYDIEQAQQFPVHWPVMTYART